MYNLNRKVFLLLGLVSALCFTHGRRAAALDPELVARATKGRFIVGVCTHFGQRKGLPEKNLQRIRDAGILSIRDELSWAGVERRPGELSVAEDVAGVLRRASKVGVAPLVIFDYANRHYDGGDRPRSDEAVAGFRRYAEFLVKYFGRDVRLYEVWNEYDIPIGLPPEFRAGGSPQDYFKMLRAVYSRLKIVDPDAVIVGAGGPTSGGINRGWLGELVKLGALDYCDIVSIHTYNHSDRGRRRSPEAWGEWTENVERMLRKHNGGRDVQLFVTEMGWPLQAGSNPMPPDLAASYLARLYLIARTMPFICGLWWYDFQDDGWDPEEKEHNFGIVRPDLTPKPAWYAMADVAGLVADGEFIARMKTEDPDLWILRFKHEGRDTWAIWSGDDASRQVILQHPSATPTGAVAVQEVGRKPLEAAWGHRPWARKRRASTIPNQLSLVVGDRPVLVSGNLQGVAVHQSMSLTPSPFAEQ